MPKKAERTRDMSESVVVGEKRRTRRGKRVTLVLMGLLILIASLAIVVIPVWLIMPFKAQTPRGIEISYLFRRWSPIVTVLATGALILLSIFMWRAARWWTRGLLV